MTQGEAEIQITNAVVAETRAIQGTRNFDRRAIHRANELCRVMWEAGYSAAVEKAREAGYDLALNQMALWDAGDCGQDAERYLYDRKRIALSTPTTPAEGTK